MSYIYRCDRLMTAECRHGCIYSPSLRKINVELLWGVVRLHLAKIFGHRCNGSVVVVVLVGVAVSVVWMFKGLVEIQNLASDRLKDCTVCVAI
eukprot:scaffold8302_cov91-Cylindrotheca_fusiformis.AAC.3